MATITDIEIQKRNKSRANIYIDGEFYCGMEMLSVMKYALKIGKEVDEKQLLDAVFDSEVDVAFNKTIDYISRALKTEKQVQEYLAKKGYDKNVSDKVVEKLLGYKYINDENYAKLYIEQNLASKGNRRLKQELIQKGIKQDIIEKYIAEIDSDSHKQNATMLAEKYMRNKTNDLKTLVKLQRYLLSRGYDYDTANNCVAQYKENK